jgi:hypothetical protein
LAKDLLPAALSEARWFGAERARTYCRILAAAQAVTLVGLAASANGGLDPRGEPLGTDFVSFWTAARLAASGAPASAYDPVAHHAAQQAAFGGDFGWYAFFYPPIFLALCLPLALAPYFVALAAWLAATGAAYLAAMRRLLDRRAGLLPILAFPGVLSNIGHGQNAFLSTAFFGFGVSFLATRPLLAGLCFGGLAYKPQLAFVLPLGLAAAGRWRALAAMAATAAALALLSYGLFGEATWRAFLAENVLARATLAQGLVEPEKMQSLFAALRLIGLDAGPAFAAQTVFTAAVCLALVVLVRRMEDALAQGALMAVAALLATPFVLDYDLTLLAIPLANLFSAALRDAFLPYEKMILLAAYLLPSVARPLGQYLHLPVAPAVILLLFAALAGRFAPQPVVKRWAAQVTE